MSYEKCYEVLPTWLGPFSRGIRRDKTKRDERSQIRGFSQIFADFSRFSLFLGITAFRRRRFSQKTAGNRWFSQETADFRRFSQKPVCPIQFVPLSSIPPYFRCIGFPPRDLPFEMNACDSEQLASFLNKNLCKSFLVLFWSFLFAQGCRNGRFGKRCLCPLPNFKTGGFDENRQKFWYCILPTKKKTRDFTLRTPEIDEENEHGEFNCHPGKRTVGQKAPFWQPRSASFRVFSVSCSTSATQRTLPY